MRLNPLIKKNWTDLQKKYDYPVNAIGVKIKADDSKTLKIWKEEGVDNFMKR